jgi:hypothetical protein
VNADLLAKGRGLRISEVTVRTDGADVLSSMSVALSAPKARFSGAIDKTGRIYIEGTVRSGRPYLTKIGGRRVGDVVGGMGWGGVGWGGGGSSHTPSWELLQGGRRKAPRGRLLQPLLTARRAPAPSTHPPSPQQAALTST